MRIFILLIFVVLTSCRDDNFDPNKDPLEGKIGGAEWKYQSGNGNFDSQRVTLSGLILENELSDPCGIVTTVKPHIQVAIPAVRGNFNLPFSDSRYSVIFSVDDRGTKYTATSGFIEIVAISSVEVVGFLSADFDDNNSVEGTFGLEICN